MIFHIPRIQTRLITNGDQQMTVTEPVPPRTRAELWAAVFADYDWAARGTVSEGWYNRQQEQFEATREGLVP